MSVKLFLGENLSHQHHEDIAQTLAERENDLSLALELLCIGKEVHDNYIDSLKLIIDELKHKTSRQNKWITLQGICIAVFFLAFAYNLMKS